MYKWISEKIKPSITQESSQSCHNVNITNSNIGVYYSGSGNVNTRDIYCSDISNDELECFALPRIIGTFEGRENEIESINSLFSRINKIVICGLPGYGKSELAKQFATRCKTNLNIEQVFWIQSENNDILAKLSNSLKKIYKKYKETRCMYIFDNGLSRQDLSEFEPPDNNNNFLLITSHESDWGDDVESFKLDPLSLDSALDVFKSILKTNYRNEDEELYKDLARVVGNVPLGLQITGGYIRQQTRLLKEKFQLGEYIELLNESEEYIFEEPIPSGIPNTYKNTLYGAIMISLNKMQTVHQRDLVLKILYVCSYLNPNRIELKVLLEISNTILDGIKLKLKNALTLLTNYSFVNYNPVDSYVILHKLTQDIVRFHLKKSHLEEKSSYYSACLHYVIDNDISLSHINLNHHSAIMLHAEQNVEIFNIFYQKHASKMSEKLDAFFNTIVLSNSIKCIKKIIEDSGDKKREFITKFKLLNKAAMFKRINILKCLLNFDANLNARDCNGETALFHFIRGECKYGNFNIDAYTHEYFNMDEVNEFFVLLEFEKNINATNNRGHNLLHITAAFCHNTELLNLLTERGFDVNSKSASMATPLHIAAFHRNFVAIKWLINHNADSNARNCNGETALFNFIRGACEREHLNMDEVNEIFELLELKKYLNVRNKEGQNLLHATAACCHNTEILNMLIERGFDVNSTNTNLTTPLHFAAFRGNFVAIKWLINHNADSNASNCNGETALFDFIRGACEREHLNMDEVNEIFELLELKKYLHVTNKEGQNLLHVTAALCHNTEMLNLLIQHGFDINSISANLNTPLHFAAFHGIFAVIMWLVNHNADSNARNCNGETALFDFIRGACIHEHFNMDEVNEIFMLLKFEKSENATNNKGLNLLHLTAAFCHNTELLNLLIQRGFDVNSTSANLTTPLHFAAFHGNFIAIKWLINHNAESNARDCTGETALFSFFRGACKREHLNIDEVNNIFVLLEFETNVTLVNNKGQHLLHIVVVLCHDTELLNLLLQRGFDVNSTDANLVTSLHLAAFQANVFKIKWLISQNADLNARDCNGETALFHFIRCACERKHLNMDEVNEIFELLEIDKNINVTNNEGNNLLHIAASRCHNTELLNLLLQRGFNVNSTNSNLVTSLHLAAFQANVLKIKWLISQNANINARARDGETPLFYFIRSICESEHLNKDEVNDILNILECRKNSNISNYNNNTLLYFAAMWCRVELVTLFLTDYEMNANHQDLQGDTPLHQVIQSFDKLGSSQEDVIRTVEALKSHGASLDIQNEDGKTPLRIAQEKEAEFLIPHLQTVTVTDNLVIIEDHFGQGSDSNSNSENLLPLNYSYPSGNKKQKF